MKTLHLFKAHCIHDTLKDNKIINLSLFQVIYVKYNMLWSVKTIQRYRIKIV